MLLSILFLDRRYFKIPQPLPSWLDLYHHRLSFKNSLAYEDSTPTPHQNPQRKKSTLELRRPRRKSNLHARNYRQPPCQKFQNLGLDLIFRPPPCRKSLSPRQKVVNVAYTLFSSGLYFFLLITLVSSSSFLSDDIFKSTASTGRALLQVQKACGVDFENQNYTILTSQCKGPQYPPKVCCEAFKQFACPFVDEINDLTSDCASIMFNYIKHYGNYPAGLFANECKEGKEGLACNQVKLTNSSNPSSSVIVAAPHSMLLVSVVGFFGFIFHLF